jgi:hypothetical protein
MSDSHIRILHRIARQTQRELEQLQRELEQHNSVDHAGDTASTGRRVYLARAAKRTRARVADAEQRRNQRPRGQRDTRHQTTRVSRSAKSLS